MNRSRQEKEQLVRKFEEILPVLKNYNNFGWLIPECDADPVFHIHPDYTLRPVPFKPFTINVQTGWHSEFVYKTESRIERIPEGITPVDPKEWSTNNCYRPCCAKPVTMVQSTS